MERIQGQAPARVAIIGCGIRGRLFTRALSQNPDAAVVAVVDADTDRARDVAASVGATACASAPEMLARHPGLDAAIIATPDFAHTDVAVECASRGLHLMIEKPLAMDTASARKIAHAVHAGGARAMVAFENRWNPRLIEARRHLHEGAVGDVTSLIAHLNDTIHVPTRMLSWADRSSPAWFLMPHTLDLAMWLTRTEPVRVYATGTRGVLDAMGIATWDALTAVVGLSDGSMLTLHSSWILPESRPAIVDFRVEIQGSRGALLVDGASHGLSLYGAGGTSWPQLGLQEWRGRLRGFPVDMVDDFVRYVRGEEIEVPGIREGLTVTAAIEAVHTSLRTGQPVALSPVDPSG